MKINYAGLTRVIKGTLKEYLDRFEEAIWDSRFLARAVIYTDLEKVVGDHTPAGVQLLLASARRFQEKGFEGYPVFKYTLTFYWVEVESFIDAFLKSWVDHVMSPDALPTFDKARLENLKFELSQPSLEEKAVGYGSRDKVLSLYVAGLKHHLQKDSQVRTFFAILDVFGLDKCDTVLRDEVERSFTELQQIRNVMVHNGGIVDGRMIKKCPWLLENPDIQVGQRFPINVNTAADYTDSMLNFNKHMWDRVTTYGGTEPAPKF